MEDMDKDFATKMIKVYGEERFYHCCKRTGSGLSVLKLHMALNESERLDSYRYLLSVGIDPYARPVSGPDETHRETMCRIAYGFVRFYKEMGRKKHELPPELNARMVFGEQNQWVINYVKLLDSFPDWNLDKLVPE
jgi:hypothetical protein